MSLSKEKQLYHLTLRGWIEGSFFGDAVGGKKIVETPTDRVLTVACVDELPAVYQKPFYDDYVEWESDNKELIMKLKKQYGEKPPWFGYDK